MFYALLEERFAPDDAIAQINMEEDLAKLKVNARNNPRNIDDKIVAIKMRYGVPLLDTRKAVIIMGAGKKVYASTLTTGKQAILLMKK